MGDIEVVGFGGFCLTNNVSESLVTISTAEFSSIDSDLVVSLFLTTAAYLLRCFKLVQSVCNCLTVA